MRLPPPPAAIDPDSAAVARISEGGGAKRLPTSDGIARPRPPAVCQNRMVLERLAATGEIPGIRRGSSGV